MEESKLQGTMTIDFQGNVKEVNDIVAPTKLAIDQSTGILAKKDFGKTILYLLEEANVLVDKELKSPFRKVTVNFKNHEYAISLDGVSIHVAVKNVENSKE